MLSKVFTYKFGKEPEVGVQPSDRLDMSIPSRGKTHNKLMIGASECGEILVVELGSQLPLSRGFAPSVEV